MKKSTTLIKSLMHAVGVLAYIFGVSLVLHNGEKIFGEGESFVIPIFMLLLLVVSASVTGLLVLGRPIHLYLSGLKKDAFVFLFLTLAWLVLFAVLAGIILLFK